MNSFDPPTEHLQLIVNLFNSGKLEQALTESKTLLEKFPNSVFLHNISGASYAGLNQFKDAITSYKKAIKFKPDFAEAYFNMAIAQKSISNFKEAINSYKKTLQIKPDYVNACFNLGNILKDMGDLEAAIDNYKMTLKIKPDYAEAYNNLGIALKDNGDLETAIDSYNMALKIKPDYIEAKENLISLLTSYTPQKDNPNLIVKINSKIRKNSKKENISKIISDDQIINLFSESDDYISTYGSELKTKQSQLFRRNSVNLNCSRHLSIFDKHNVIPEFCFGCYKVQVEPRSVIELIKLFIIFDQLELKENNTRKCMVELRPEISGFYKGLIYCSGLKQANQIADHLDIIIKESIGSDLSSTVKRGCSEYAISYPDYKEINQSGPQVMNYDNDWKEIEVSYDRKNPVHTEQIIRTSLSGINLSDILIIRKWIDYAKGIGDPSADLLNHNTVNYQLIHDRAKARLKLFKFGKN